MALIEVNGFIQTHDPTIIKENNVYYRIQTGPGIPVSVSADLKDWKYLTKVFETNPGWTSKVVPGSTDFWAPDAVYRNGQWRLYYSVSTFGKNVSAIGYAVNKTLDVDSKDYCWEDRGYVIKSSRTDDFNCIDPAVIADENGNDWLLFGSFWGGLKMVPLETDGTVKSGAKLKTVASRKTEPNPVEGGFIFKHADFYYLFASHDFCCRGSASSYHIVVGRSKSITGPYLDDIGVDMNEGGGLMLRNGLSFKRWAGPGHNSVFHDSDGTDYIVYHGYDRTENGMPKLLLEKIDWSSGWPVLD